MRKIRKSGQRAAGILQIRDSNAPFLHVPISVSASYVFLRLCFPFAASAVSFLKHNEICDAGKAAHNNTK